ncbi:MAG: amidohydrolase [Phycisphaeraceae bacterium]|nr:amidohydrolase [Phycisphaerales bacterium]MCB9861589.1 amidohydrolase [Phycisphaeraceae bacterium]
MPPHFFKIDVHTHILPPDWPDLGEKYGYGRFLRMMKQYDENGCCNGAQLVIDGDKFRYVKPNCFDHAVRLSECDALGVDIQVLSTVPVMFSYWAQPQHTLELSMYLNDHIAEICREHPKRFVGLGTLPMQDPQLACKELERCINDLGLVGIEIGSHIEQPRSADWNLSEPALLPVFETAEKLGAAIFVHPWDMMGEEDMGKYWLPWLVGMPAETARAVCSMIFGGVFERFPKLRVMFAHGGGSFPYTIGRIEHGWNCRPDLVAIDSSHNPWSYLAEPGKPAQFFVDSLVHSRNALRYLIALMDERRVALGSDYPFPLGEEKPGAIIDSMYDLTDQTKQRLLAGTAVEFLQLDAAKYALPAALSPARV